MAGQRAAFQWVYLLPGVGCRKLGHSCQGSFLTPGVLNLNFHCHQLGVAGELPQEPKQNT